jgi:septal ring factor EnvC (AmiA/AmiB activator)
MTTSNSSQERGTGRNETRTSAETTVVLENPLKQTASRLESLRQGLKDLMGDVNLALTSLKAAERDQKNNEKEIEAVRSTLRSLQKVQI